MDYRDERHFTNYLEQCFTAAGCNPLVGCEINLESHSQLDYYTKYGLGTIQCHHGNMIETQNL